MNHIFKQHHHCQEHEQENTQRIAEAVIKLLPSIINRIPTSLGSPRPEFFLFVFLLLLSPLLLGASSVTDQDDKNNPSSHRPLPLQASGTSTVTTPQLEKL